MFPASGVSYVSGSTQEVIAFLIDIVCQLDERSLNNIKI
jgi:hypothetical protein